LSSEEFTESLNQRRKQIESGRIFFCTGYSNVQEAKDVLNSRDENAWMEYAGHVRGDAGNRPNLKSVSSGGWTVTMVSREAAHMEQIFQFLSYMTQEEATLDAAPGIGAGTYEIVDGIYKRKESVEKEFAEDYEAAAEKYYLNLEFFVDWTIVQKYQPASDRLAYQRQYGGCDIYDSKAVEAAQAVGADEDMQELKEKIDAFYDTAEVEILTSESEEICAQNYQETIEKMEAMGLEELEAYESRQYRQAKLRIQEMEASAEALEQ
jgi:putative aldouronate transport system substrate-binding protein